MIKEAHELGYTADLIDNYVLSLSHRDSAKKFLKSIYLDNPSDILIEEVCKFFYEDSETFKCVYLPILKEISENAEESLYEIISSFWEGYKDRSSRR